jgi:two-component system cell cycle response regulator DivK
MDGVTGCEALTPANAPRADAREEISVLVVDDYRDARDMLAEYLSSRGFVVHTAADGLEAINVAVHFLPSIILMDVMMPRMDGWEATRRLKADARTRDIPIIALSAHPQPDGKAVARAVGCEDLWSKPFDLDRLAYEMRECLERRSRSVDSRSIH